MKLGFPNGVGSDDGFNTAEKVECWFQALAAIPVGTAVMPDLGGASTTTGNTGGRKVASATTALDHDIIGIFEGDGLPTGTKNTTSGLGKGTNRAAVTSDVILVTVYGPAQAIFDNKVAATAGDPLTISTATNGYLIACATVAAPSLAHLMILGTATNATTASATGTATCSVWCHLL